MSNSSEGLEGFDGSDAIIPELVMVQATTRDIPGLSSEKTGEPVDQVAGLFADKKRALSYGKKLQVVLLHARKQRTLWFSDTKLADDKTKKGKKCWSADGITPDAKVPADQKQSASCSTCKFSRKPLDDAEYPMLFLDVERSKEAGFPVLFKFVSKKTANDPVRSLADTLKKRKRPLRDFQFTMSTMRDQNGKGNYANLQFTGISVVEDDALKALVEEVYLTHVESGNNSVRQESEEPASESKF